MAAVTMVLALPLPASSAPAAQECDSGGYAASSPTARFRSEPDGTVTDTKSKLMWMRCSAGQTWSESTCAGTVQRVSWSDAQNEVNKVNKSGSHFYNDWRVPQLPELATIAELVCKNPRINLTIFPNTPADFFWSATSRQAASPESFAFVLSFGQEGVRHEPKDEKHYVRWVRNAS